MGSGYCLALDIAREIPKGTLSPPPLPPLFRPPGMATAWAGVRYEDGPWALVGAYYFFSQNSFLNASDQTCAVSTTAALRSATFIGTRVGSNCSGDFNQGSFLIDYTFNRHLDVYAGVTFTEQSGGLNSGYLQNSDVAFATGLRVKW